MVYTAKNFIANLCQILNFVLINANKNNAVIRQQIPRQHQPRIHHTAPVGVKPSVAVIVLEQPILVLVIHPHLTVFFILRTHKIVCIDNIVARIIRRVNVNHFDFAQITLLQQLEHFQIVTLNIEILGIIPVFAFCRAGAQGLADGLVGFHNGCLFAHPCKLVCFISVYNVRREHLLQQFKVDTALVNLVVGGAFLLVQHFRDAVGEERGDFINVLGCQVGGLKGKFVM